MLLHPRLLLDRLEARLERLGAPRFVFVFVFVSLLFFLTMKDTWFFFVPALNPLPLEGSGIVYDSRTAVRNKYSCTKTRLVFRDQATLISRP